MKPILLFLVILGWFALTAQFYLIIENRVTSIPETICRYFTFFTILTNLLVAVSFSSILIISKSASDNFFSRPKVLTAITVYITIVGIVYNVILRFLWKPDGLQFIVDEILHTIIPVLSIVFWFLYVSKSNLKWKDAFPWLIYPLVYIIVVLFRGDISGFYPYPFIDVGKIGYNKVLFNSGILTLSFLLVSFLFILIGKKTKISNKM
ncbi:MAG: Pr6Pr family membrane protein [Bacteroidota bacterium]|nr:Pr6Pr family membrane protein [Bacteroidota bacterium]